MVVWEEEAVTASDREAVLTSHRTLRAAAVLKYSLDDTTTSWTTKDASEREDAEDQNASNRIESQPESSKIKPEKHEFRKSLKSAETQHKLSNGRWTTKLFGSKSREVKSQLQPLAKREVRDGTRNDAPDNKSKKAKFYKNDKSILSFADDLV
mmetsp:Transcript_24790/g.34169  ORF Transcript_24790/g.34169 Transcript_24790/m.34169 type:complete len:153 (+) Transcript_24790:65-523(+)